MYGFSCHAFAEAVRLMHVRMKLSSVADTMTNILADGDTLSGYSAGSDVTVVSMSAARTARPGAADQDPRIEFIAGSLCLDFLGTAEAKRRHGPDLLANAEHFQRWLEGAGLPSPAGSLSGQDLASARELRAGIDGVVRAIVATGRVSADDVQCINSFARHPTPVFLLRPGGRDRAVVEEADISSSLAVIARDAVHMLADSDLARLRECARDGCSTLFLDRSPAARRRWCAMKGCGEIVAAASYRQRRATGAQA
jgi:predicted RNA-binding Zn ribbon-like protein